MTTNQFFVKSTPISVEARAYDNHGNVTVDNDMDWWKHTARKWFPEFDQRASNITVTFVGNNPHTPDGSTKVYVLSFTYTGRDKIGRPEIMQISRHSINPATGL